MTTEHKPHSVPWLVGNVERAVQIAPWEIQTNSRAALDTLVLHIQSLEEQLEALRLEHALAVVLITDAESLIRYLRPDLNATRPRADELLKRINAFVMESSPASRQDG